MYLEQHMLRILHVLLQIYVNVSFCADDLSPPPYLVCMPHCNPFWFFWIVDSVFCCQLLGGLPENGSFCLFRHMPTSLPKASVAAV